MVFDVEAFYYALDRERRRRRTSWTAIARDIGVVPESVIRLGLGHPPSVGTLVGLLDWLGQGYDLTPFLKPDKPKPSEQ